MADIVHTRFAQNKGRAPAFQRNIGDQLMEKGKVSGAEIKEALRLKAIEGILIGQAMVKLGMVTEEDVAKAVAETKNLKYVDLEEETPPPELTRIIPRQLAERYRIIPLKKRGKILDVAVDRPLPVQVLRNLERVSKSAIEQHIAATGKLIDSIALLYDASAVPDMEGATAVDIVDEMIKRAIRMKASDIHIEPFEDRVCLRLRVDGMLQEIETYSPELLPSLTSRIKVMADLNIAEKRAPQDGAIVYQNDRYALDLRVSTIPAIHGEKIVMRLLAGQGYQLKMDQIGLSDEDLEMFSKIINRPYGIILIVGPTGSGKSTTLSAALNTIRRPDINITTVEDPVEYKIDGITQVHVGRSDKINFASALRSILRQDPDVIMVGEVRDRQTAEISLRAALTGHMVFTTLHTNDAPSALPRLIDMGCEPFLVSSSVRGILAQRLVRRLCPKCREPYEPTREEIIGFDLDPDQATGPWYRKKGCPACLGTGYKGRMGIFELLEVNEAIQREVMAGSPSEVIKQLARKQGKMKTLREDAIRKVMMGVTSVEEVFRVTLDD